MLFWLIVRGWTLRLLGVLRLRRRDSEIEEELRLHLEFEAENAGHTAQVTKEAGRLARIRMERRRR